MIKIDLQFFGGRGSSGSRSSEEDWSDLKIFSDVPRDEQNYAGSGDEVENYFKENSNSDMLIEKMKKSDRRSFTIWGLGLFADGSQYEDKSLLSDVKKEYMKSYDKILDKVTLKKDTQLVRLADAQLIQGAGSYEPDPKKLVAAEGSIVYCPGNMSFAAAKEGLTISSRMPHMYKSVEYKLRIKGGTVGAGMYIGDRRINKWGSKQREFMVNRDGYFKVGKTVYNKQRNVYEVTLDYLGHGKHTFE